MSVVTRDFLEIKKEWEEIQETTYLEFPFVLDEFQKIAVHSLHTKKEDIFITAHTSSGKTLVADYAIAQALQSDKEDITGHVIYTAPIKALSNQKFSDFRKTFGKENLGILTGDVNINENAPCLVCTTEILRNMLYKDSPRLNKLVCVVFDEVHYLADKERGVVWEECMILLPKHVRLVLLSATVANSRRFAGWLSSIRENNVLWLETLQRPVPLKHFVWHFNRKFLLHKSGDELNQNNLLEKKSETMAKMHCLKVQCLGVLREVEQAVNKQKSTHCMKRNSQSFMGQEYVDFLTYYGLYGKKEDKESLYPCILFTLSIRRVEKIAERLVKENSAGALIPVLPDDRNSTKAAVKIRLKRLVDSALAKLEPENRKLPQVNKVCAFLEAGVAIHHSGILPMLRELCELAFKKKLVAFLIATETFAMGMNFPAKTVLFDSVKKNDGRTFRGLTPAEYTQMSGRAGRRGIDKAGHVFIMCKKLQFLEREAVLNALFGLERALESKFRITHVMALRAVRSYRGRFVDFANKSFIQFDANQLMPEKQRKIQVIEETLLKQKDQSDSGCACRKKDFEDFLNDYQLFMKYSHNLTSLINKHKPFNCKFISTGRMFVVEARRVQEDSQKSKLMCPLLGVIISYPVTKGKNPEHFFVAVFKVPFPVLLGLGNNVQLQESQTAKFLLDFEMEAKEGVFQVLEFGIIKATSVAGYIKTDLSRSFVNFVASIDRTNLSSEKRQSVAWRKPTISKDNQNRFLKKFLEEVAMFDEETAKCMLFNFFGTKETALGSIEAISMDKTRNLKRNLIMKSQLFTCEKFFQTLLPDSTENSKEFQMAYKSHFFVVCTFGNEILELKKLRTEIDDESSEIVKEFRRTVLVLADMQLLQKDEDEMFLVTVKGTFGAEISTSESCLFLTELYFRGAFAELSESELAAVLSCFVSNMNTQVNFADTSQAADEHIKPYRDNELNNTHRFAVGSTIEEQKPAKRLNSAFDLPNVVKFFQSALAVISDYHRFTELSGVATSKAEIRKEFFKTGLVSAVYWWTNGVDFASICEDFEVSEGMLMKCVHRLNDLCIEFMAACNLVGDLKMKAKLQKVTETLKREILFVESLYFDETLEKI